MGTGSVTTRFCCCFRLTDGACPLFRTVNAGRRGKRGQAPSGHCFPAIPADSCSEPVPIFHSRLQFEFVWSDGDAYDVEITDYH